MKTHPFKYWRHLLHALHLVNSGKYRNPRGGICQHVSDLAPKARPLLDQMIAAWPGHSGISGYPVRADDDPLGAFEQYMRAAPNGGLWDGDTKYVRDRFALLRWLINRLKALPDSRDEADIALERLLEIREAVHRKKSVGHVKFDPEVGLCTLYYGGGDVPRPTPSPTAMALPWPEHSGNSAYPVSVSVSGTHRRRQEAPFEYNRAQDSRTMWDASKPYGQARLRLLNWLIEMLETSGDVWD